MYKIAVLISGEGSNLQTIMEKVESAYLNCEIFMVISDNKNAKGLQKAKEKNILAIALDRKENKGKLSDKINELLFGKVDLLVLAGFTSILQGEILSNFKNRIINVHPSLIPSFCGKNMYGIKVHEKALEYGVKLSGCTVHLVNEQIDAGSIILQKAVEISDTETAETLQKKILNLEHELLPYAIKLFSENKIVIQERKILIKK